MCEFEEFISRSDACVAYLLIHTFQFLVVLLSVAALIDALCCLVYLQGFGGFYLLSRLFPFRVFSGLICRVFVPSLPSCASPVSPIILICFTFMCTSNYVPFVGSLCALLPVCSGHPENHTASKLFSGLFSGLSVFGGSSAIVVSFMSSVVVF